MEKQLPKQLDGIPVEAIIDVQFSGGFYQRLHQLLNYHCSKEGPEVTAKALQEIKANDVKSPAAYHLETLVTMILETEKKAKEQGKMKTVDIPQG